MLREVLPDTRSSRGPSQQIGFPSSAHTPSNTKFPVPNSGYSPHKKAKPVSWGLGPFPAGSGPFVTPLSWQGLCGSSRVWGLAHVTLSIGQKGSSSQDDISSVNISVYVFLKLFCRVLSALPWSPSPPGCSRLPRIPEAGKGNQRDVNNQTSYHPELKADVGICICPGPFLHHSPIPSPGVSEQSSVDYKHRKDEAGNPGSLWSARITPQTRGAQPEIPASLPPASLPVLDSFGRRQRHPGYPSTALPGRWQPQMCQGSSLCTSITPGSAAPPKETFPEHAELTPSSHHVLPCLSLRPRRRGRIQPSRCPGAGIWLRLH